MSAKSGNLLAKPGHLSADASRRLVAFLMRQHGVKPLEMIASEAGVSADAVRRWFDGSTAPGFLPLLRLVNAYGPDLLCAVFDEPPGWLARARSAELQSALTAEIAALSRNLDCVARDLAR